MDSDIHTSKIDPVQMMILVGIDDLISKYHQTVKHSTKVPEEIRLLGTQIEHPNRVWLASMIVKICTAKKQPMTENDLIDSMLAGRVISTLCGNDTQFQHQFHMLTESQK